MKKMKNLKRVIVLIALTATSYGLLSQAIEIDERLKACYSDEYLINLQEKSPSTLDILNFNLDNSWFIAGDDITSKKDSFDYLYYIDPETMEKSENRVENIDINNVNISKYFIEREYDRYVFYKIGDSDLIIGFYSLKKVAELYNKSK